MNIAIRVPAKANKIIEPMFLKKGRFFMFKALSKRIGGRSMIMKSGSKAFLMVEESLAAPKSFIRRPG